MKEFKVGEYEQDNRERIYNEQFFDIQISPEVEDRIMKKLTDVLAEGTMYHTLARTQTPEEIKKVFAEGIIAGGSRRQISSIKGYRQMWKQGNQVRKDLEETAEEKGKYRQGIIYANKIMKENDFFDDSVILDDLARKGFSLTFVLDTKGLPRDIIPPDEKLDLSTKLVVGHELIKRRIGPRFFRGLVIGVGEKNKIDDLNVETYREIDEFESTQKRNSSIEERLNIRHGILRTFGEAKQRDHEKIWESLKKVAQLMLMVDKTRLEFMLPIYDLSGNLIWPRSISHNEILAELAQRRDKAAPS